MIKDWFESKTFRGILYGIGITIIALAIFQLGIIVGSHKVRFAERLSGSFERNFGIRNDFMQDMMGIEGHGTVGKIVSVALPDIIVSGPDNVERTIRIGNETVIRQFREQISADKLSTGEYIVALGAPDVQGFIEAKLIRVLPPPPQASVSSSPVPTNTANSL